MLNELFNHGNRRPIAIDRRKRETESAVPPGTRFLSLDPTGGGTRVPVYSLRDPLHRRAVARALAAGRSAAFYLGLFTIVKALRPPWDGGETGELFWQVKPDRPRWSKLPVIARPEDALPLIDFTVVHPEFRHLAGRRRFARLWEAHGAPLHIIAPLREPVLALHPAFQTTVADLHRQAASEVGSVDRLLLCTTASFCWMPDPAWEDLATLVRRQSPPHTFLGGTSFNEHAEQPPYTYDELVAYVRRRGKIDFDLVVSDELIEQAGVFSSHTMVRLPLVGEPPALVMVRQGSVTPERLEASTGHPARVLGSVKSASRHPGVSDVELEARLRRFQALRDGHAA